MARILMKVKTIEILAETILNIKNIESLGMMLCHFAVLEMKL